MYINLEIVIFVDTASCLSRAVYSSPVTHFTLITHYLYIFQGEEKKTTITNVLREDPRSVYLRERWGSHCYVFRIADLHVSCKFNDNSHLVTVYQVFQNDTPQGED